jgi:hypothetical protein
LNLNANLRRYLYGDNPATGRKPDARYSSFDYCFNYFQSFRESGNVAAIAHAENLQPSCLQLGFYLASWGMLRGSAELLKKSARHLVPVVQAIASMAPALWEIDADSYSESNIERLLAQASILSWANLGKSQILVTKVMLGVFGSVPAFDTNFKRGFGVSTFCANALRDVEKYYHQNADLLDKYRVRTLDFVTGQQTDRRYPRAKVIDMAFFIEGEKQRRKKAVEEE